MKFAPNLYHFCLLPLWPQTNPVQRLIETCVNKILSQNIKWESSLNAILILSYQFQPSLPQAKPQKQRFAYQIPITVIFQARPQ